VHICLLACLCVRVRVRVRVRVLVRVLASACWCVRLRFRHRVIDIVEGIDFALMEKSYVMFKVMGKLIRRADVHLLTICPRSATYAGGSASSSHHAALNGSTILPRPRGLMHAPQCPLSSDVLVVQAQVGRIIDKFAPSIIICTVAGLILLRLLLLVAVSCFAP
jgi:hypothetical protein